MSENKFGYSSILDISRMKSNLDDILLYLGGHGNRELKKYIFSRKPITQTSGTIFGKTGRRSRVHRTLIWTDNFGIKSYKPRKGSEDFPRFFLILSKCYFTIFEKAQKFSKVFFLEWFGVKQKDPVKPQSKFEKSTKKEEKCKNLTFGIRKLRNSFGQ